LTNFDELHSGQAGQAYWSLVDAYIVVVTYATDAVRWCRLWCITVCPLVSSSKTKLRQISSVQLRRSVRIL